jgi:hypothetical protein
VSLRPTLAKLFIDIVEYLESRERHEARNSVGVGIAQLRILPDVSNVLVSYINDVIVGMARTVTCAVHPLQYALYGGMSG